MKTTFSCKKAWFFIVVEKTGFLKISSMSCLFYPNKKFIIEKYNEVLDLINKFIFQKKFRWSFRWSEFIFLLTLTIYQLTSYLHVSLSLFFPPRANTAWNLPLVLCSQESNFCCYSAEIRLSFQLMHCMSGFNFTFMLVKMVIGFTMWTVHKKWPMS